MRGLRTVNVVRRDSAVAAVKALGADVVLVDGDDLAKRVREATGGAAIKLGVDAVGGKATDRLARCLGEGGTLVNYGLMSGEPCVVSAEAFVFKDVTLRGFWLAKWFGSPAGAATCALRRADGALATGELTARVHATYPVDASARRWPPPRRANATARSWWCRRSPDLAGEGHHRGGRLRATVTRLRSFPLDSRAARGAQQLLASVGSPALFSASRRGAPARGSCCGGRPFGPTALWCSRRVVPHNSLRACALRSNRRGKSDHEAR